MRRSEHAASAGQSARHATARATGVDGAGRSREGRAAYALAWALAACAGAAIAVTWLASEPALSAARDAVAWAERENGPAGRAIVTVALAALGALGVVGAWARAVSGRRPVRVADARGTMPVADLAAWARDALEARGDVLEARVWVRNRQRRGAEVAAQLLVAPDARLAETARAAEATVQSVLVAQAGVRLAGPVAIELRYEELLMHPRRSDA